MKRKKLITAMEKVAHHYGCNGTEASDLICDAFRRLAAELENRPLRHGDLISKTAYKR